MAQTNLRGLAQDRDTSRQILNQIIKLNQSNPKETQFEKEVDRIISQQLQVRNQIHNVIGGEHNLKTATITELGLRKLGSLI